MADSRYWSKDLVTSFIEVYKANPCLWKIKSKEYTNKNLKNIAYDKLIDICKPVNPEANKDYVVKKIQSFRGSFRKELKRVLESKRSGAGEEDVYVPTLWYYDLLIFTVDQEVPTDSISNMDMEIEVVEEEGEAEEGNIESDSLERNRTDITQEESVASENQTQNRLLTKIPDTPTASTSKLTAMKSRNVTKRQKGKRQSNSDFMEFCKNQLESNNDIDEYDAVAISWAKKIKRMDTTKAIYAESLINKIITEGLFKRLKDSTTVCDEEQQRSTPFSSYTILSEVSDRSDQHWQLTSPTTVPQQLVEIPSTETTESALVDFYTTAASLVDSDPQNSN